MNFESTKDNTNSKSVSSSLLADGQHEFAFKDEDFNFIRNFIYKSAGIVLHDNKKVMVYARLSKRLRELRINSFKEYCKILDNSSNSTEIGNLINALTTNLTRFFRESHHFDHLKNVVFENYKKEKNNGSFRIWSAGCSSGEEPYSIAMTAADSLNLHVVDLKILATDIDTEMLESAKNKTYRKQEDIHGNYFQKFCDSNSQSDFNIKPSIKSLVHFKQLNLLEKWPMKGRFDVIFCRNVVIYFDKKTQVELFNRFADMLNPNGWLYIGHSENLHHISDRFELQEKTVYRRIS